MVVELICFIFPNIFLDMLFTILSEHVAKKKIKKFLPDFFRGVMITGINAKHYIKKLNCTRLMMMNKSFLMNLVKFLKTARLRKIF